jgi:pSer/pThr/pTyr-binding forkhead associated (FHA) protein
MAKLILKFEDRILKEIPLGQGAVTIGRLPTNSVAIDNPAVSGQHARVFVEGGQFVVEDLNSRNGTFVNDKPVNKHILQEGDLIAVGKHSLVFYGVGTGEAPADTPAAAAASGPAVQEFGGTMMLDTKAQKELLAQAKAKQQAAAAGETPAEAPPPPKEGTLTVVSGKTDKPQYLLEAQTTIIGKSDTAQVRLKGWFKPKVAAAITRKGDKYMVTPLSGKAQINGQPLQQAYELKPGDVLQVAGVTFQFVRPG